jgi:osmoprotectant transport system ATP-binding protein
LEKEEKEVIRYEHVTKIFPGSKIPAVNDLTMEVEDGEICILVGPSGCGKTTTMKMTNRLIEPTSGKIYINGVDNQEIDPIKLRLNIGYVIQEIGLFPHMTIAENIATVLVEKKWKKEDIAKRVDELLNLMGLDPKIYRNRRPSDLSGGQQQRVGVARALASNPPIMLMDEPFGAVDPITRARLQNEFLRLQEQMRKTIIFVTHDIDEAIKMGDKIAVMRSGKLVQFATPDELLRMPADEFVAKLVGGNRSIKRLHLIRVEDTELRPLPQLKRSSKREEAKQKVENNPLNLAAVVDERGRLIGMVGISELKAKGYIVDDFYTPIQDYVDLNSTLSDTLSIMLGNGDGYAIVADEKKSPIGVITIDDIFAAVKSDAA